MKKLVETDRQVEIREKLEELIERRENAHKDEKLYIDKFNNEKCRSYEKNKTILDIHDTCTFCEHVELCKKKIYRDKYKSAKFHFEDCREHIEHGYVLYFKNRQK